MSKLKISLNLLLILCTGSILAQEISLKEVIKIALENNYQIQIAEAQNEITAKNNTWSEAGLFPTVTLNANWNNTIQDNRNNPFTFTPGLLLQQSLSPSLNVNWNIFSGFLVQMSKTRLEQLEQQSNGNAMLLVENTLLDVIKAYYNAVLQKEKLKMQTELLELSRKRIALIEIKKEYGGSNSLELMQFQNAYFSDSMNVLLQELNYQNAQRNLSLLLNFNTDTLLIPSESLNFKLPNLDENAYRKELLKNNLNIKNQYINIDLAATQTKIQQSFLYPTVSMQLGYQYSRNSFRELENNLFEANVNVPSYFGSVSLRYNLYNNWKSKRAIEVAKIQEEIALLSLKDLEKNVSAQAENFLSLFSLRNKVVNVSFQNLDYAQRAYNLAEERFNFGSLNSVDLMSIRNNYIQSQLAHLDNLYNRIDTFFELYRLGGMLSLNYVSQN